MDELVYKALDKYFKILSAVGYKSYVDVYKLLYVTLIRDFVYNDFRGLITEDDYRIIEKSLYNVYGTTCLVPYPQFCNDMNKLKLGSISELAYKVNNMQVESGTLPDVNWEELKDKVDTLFNRQVVTPHDPDEDNIPNIVDDIPIEPRN